MLSIERVAAGYGEIRVLHDVSLEVAAGQVVALLGANGAGKTTLLRAAVGLLDPSAGRIVLNGNLLNRVPAHEIVQRGLIMVPEGRALFPFMTVEENLELGSYAKRARGQRSYNLDRVYHLLPRLKERRRQIGGLLSGGEQQMCAIGRGLMACPEILLLDEPSLGLAPVIVRDIFALLAELRNEGLSILLVEQHVTHALALADRAYVLQNGRIAMSGPGPELLRNPALKRAYMGQKH
jgi:branched-chain amino acid transport system ATP-binding protein